jgi:hypothetical protein
MKRRCLSSGLLRRVDLQGDTDVSGKHIVFILSLEALKVEYACSPETSVSSDNCTRRYNPEDQHGCQ